MSRHRAFNPQPWGNGFVANQPELVTKKVEQIRAAGRDRLSLSVDFDETLIVGSTWYMLYALMSSSKQERHAKDAFIHVPKLSKGELTWTEAHNWQKAAIRRLYGLRMRDIDKAFAQVPLVDGAADLMHIAEAAGVPRIIRSAGIANAIGAVAAYNDIHPSAIIATNLKSFMGFAVGHHRETFTHDLSKAVAPHPLLNSLLKGRDQQIAVGDRMLDTLMVEGTDALRIRVDGVLEPGPERDAYLRESFLGDQTGYPFAYDLVAVGGNLEATAQLLGELVTPLPKQCP